MLPLDYSAQQHANYLENLFHNGTLELNQFLPVPSGASENVLGVHVEDRSRSSSSLSNASILV